MNSNHHAKSLPIHCPVFEIDLSKLNKKNKLTFMTQFSQFLRTTFFNITIGLKRDLTHTEVEFEYSKCMSIMCRVYPT